MALVHGGGARIAQCSLSLFAAIRPVSRPKRSCIPKAVQAMLILARPASLARAA
jgi:hypothetical protein